MLITRVELEDIKNYETGSFSFGPGVTAIGGPNGAGKTTILEAIAWALFDHLPYKKEDFLRRGAKRGSVRVTFESALDGREYTVYRDTGSGYYIYDPITKLRLVEQKNQVGIWIKQHLGVEPTADLKTLFTSTIGVPQGTFTVDFSDQPAKRKVSFDKVLRVDEYQRSSEELRSLIRLVESRDGELREEIARVEVEVAALDGLMTERSRYQALAEGLKQELSNAERNLDKARKELERLDRLQRSIERTTIDYAALSSKIEDIERRRASVAYEVERARRANEAVIRATAGFTNYTEAQMCLSQLEPRAVHRDAIKEEHSVKERELIRTESTAHHQREKIRQLEADRVEMERLRPLAEEQEALESRRAELQTSLGQLTVLEERSAIAERELKALRADYADLLKQSEEIEKLKELAERAPVLEQERRLAESELRDLQVALERLGERKKEMKRVRDNIAKLEGEIKTLEKEMAAGLEAEQVVANLSQLEGEDQAAMEEIAQLKASIERDKQILSKIQGGLCPLLSERCLNMKEGQGLDQYFKIQMGSEREQLAVVEGKRKAIQRKLIDAKAALKIASALASQRVQHSRYLESLEIERDTHQRLGAEIKSTQVNEKAVRQASDRLEQLEKDRQQAQAARSSISAESAPKRE